MPKVSKVKVRAASSKPGDPSPPKETPGQYVCTRCGRVFSRQYHNFPTSQSPLYRGNGGYLTTCTHCADDLYNHYREALQDDKMAMQRICMKFDIYWNPDIYAMVDKVNTTNSRVRSYISKTNLYRYIGKTYDDTLDEAVMNIDGTAVMPVTTVRGDDDKGETVDLTNPPAGMVKFWGTGLPPEMYFALDARYIKWTENFENGLDSVAEARYKQICILEETINRSVAQTGKSDAATVNALNNLIKDAQKGDGADESFDDLPFGVGIRMFENARPVPKPIPELQDVDGIVKYISVWFLGHLCKMLGIKNTYCKLYEEEMAKRRVERPDLEEEDDEGAFNDIFGGGGSE